MDQIITLKREVFRWRMRKQALEKEFQEKRRQRLRNETLSTEQGLGFKELEKSFTENDEAEIERNLDYLLAKENYLEVASQAYSMSINEQLVEYILQNTNFSVLEKAVIFLNDILIAIPGIFKDQEQIQSILHKICWMIDFENQANLSNACVVFLGNMIQEEEKLVTEYLLENPDVLKRLPGQNEEEAFFISSFIKTVTKLGYENNQFQFSQILVLIMNLILKFKTAKLFKTLSLLLKQIKQKDEIRAVQQFNHFPLFVNQLLEILQLKGSQYDLQRYYCSQSLHRLINYLDIDWIKLMVQTGLIEGIKQLLMESPSIQKEGIKLMNKIVDHVEIYSNLIEFFTKEQINDLLNVSNKIRVLDVFSQILSKGNTPLGLHLIQMNILYHFKEILLELDNKNILLTLQMLIQIIDIDASDEWYDKIDNEIQRVGILQVVETLQKHQDTEIQLNANYIIDTL